MSEYVKRSGKGRYYNVGRRYSAETYASIFKVAVEYRKVTGVYPLPAHLSKMTSVSIKVAKKALMYISRESDFLHKPSGHGYSGVGSMKLTMTDQFFYWVCTIRTQVHRCTHTLPNSTLFPEQK